MRVLFYHSRRDWSGGARAFASAARVLVERGFQVIFACPVDSDVERRVSYQGFEVAPTAAAGARATDIATLRRLLLDRFVEVVFVHTEREHVIAAAAVRLAARGAVVRRVPPGGPITFGRPSRVATRLAASGFLLDPGDLSAAPAVPRHGRLLEPVAGDLGVDPAEVDAAPESRALAFAAHAAGPVLVAVHDGRAPGMHTVLRAAALLAPRHPGLTLTIIEAPAATPGAPAAGPGHDALRLHAASLGIAPLVRYVAGPEERLAALRRADAAWIVGAGDEGAFAALDAMALGVPVVAARDTVAARVVSDGATGLVVPPDDEAAAAAALALLLGRPDRRAAWGAAARARVSARWPLAALGDGFQRAAEQARDRARWIT